MTLGVGIDLVSVSRFETALARWGERLTARLFTPEELAYAMTRVHPALHLAVRFAAKEAVFKALGLHRALGVRWTDVEVSRVPPGGPFIRLWGEARGHAQAQGMDRVLISLSHDGGLAVAQATVLGRVQ